MHQLHPRVLRPPRQQQRQQPRRRRLPHRHRARDPDHERRPRLLRPQERPVRPVQPPASPARAGSAAATAAGTPPAPRRGRPRPRRCAAAPARPPSAEAARSPPAAPTPPGRSPRTAPRPRPGTSPRSAEPSRTVRVALMAAEPSLVCQFAPSAASSAHVTRDHSTTRGHRLQRQVRGAPARQRTRLAATHTSALTSPPPQETARRRSIFNHPASRRTACALDTSARRQRPITCFPGRSTSSAPPPPRGPR